MEVRLPSSFFGPGGRQAGAALLALGIPGNDGGGVQGHLDAGDEVEPPRDRIQTDDTRADREEAHSPFQQGPREGGIMNIGRREQKKDRQARAATE